MHKRLTVFLVAALLIGGGYYHWDRVPSLYWYGSFELQVRLRSEVPIRSLRWMKVHRRGDADAILRTWQHADLGPWTVWNGDSTWPLRIRIPTFGSDASSGRELTYVQEEAIIFDGEFADGRPIRRAFRLPDGRHQREMEIALEP
jgi:hypothetical protein